MAPGGHGGRVTRSSKGKSGGRETMRDTTNIERPAFDSIIGSQLLGAGSSRLRGGERGSERDTSNFERGSPNLSIGTRSLGAGSSIERGRTERDTTNFERGSPNLSIGTQSLGARSSIERGGRNRTERDTIDFEGGSPDAHSSDVIFPVRKRVRGPTRNIAADKAFSATGAKLYVLFAPGDNKPTGENQRAFNNEIGTIVRNHAPLAEETFGSIIEDTRTELMKRIITKFDVDISNEVVRNYINVEMASRYSDYRYHLKKHFLKFATYEEALRNKPRTLTQEVWEQLCKLFTSDSFQARSRKGKENRSKLLYNHCGGSKPFVQYQYEDESGEPLPSGVKKGPIDVFKITHHKKDENRWVSLDAETRYAEMIQLRDDPENKMTETQICAKVLGKKSGYVRGRGHGPRPESSASKYSQSTDMEAEEMKEELTRLREFANMMEPYLPLLKQLKESHEVAHEEDSREEHLFNDA